MGPHSPHRTTCLVHGGTVMTHECFVLGAHTQQRGPAHVASKPHCLHETFTLGAASKGEEMARVTTWDPFQQ
jgi:hypothetical protein